MTIRVIIQTGQHLESSNYFAKNEQRKTGINKEPGKFSPDSYFGLNEPSVPFKDGDSLKQIAGSSS